MHLNEQLLKSKAFVDGSWISADSGETFNVTNPATGEVITTCANFDELDVRNAIEKAEVAFRSWRMLPAKVRADYLKKWYALVMDNADALAAILTAEQGKSLNEARGEVVYGASYIEWFAEEARRSYGETIPTTANDRRLLTYKQPVGVVSAITPWNFPIAMITRKAAPALAAGCSIVIKPAAETPLSALALVELASRAGIPNGVINVVTSNRSSVVGKELSTNELVKKVTFTGSTPVGKVLLTQAAQSVKKVSMELGGNAPILVFSDADLELAASGAISSKFRNCGQTCICANRILVHDDVYDEFVAIFVKKMRQLKQGNGFEEGVDIGPLVSAKAVTSVEQLVADAKQLGAGVVSMDEAPPAEGNYYPPTVLTDVSSKARVFKEEIFGPVAPIFRFSTDEEAVAMANDTEYGLAAYLYTSTCSRAWLVSEALEYGMVGINETAITADIIPFGGVKESGLGREGSKHGLDDFMELKYVCMGGL